jgi:hypothetical protein
METQMKIAVIGGIFAVIVAITQVVIPAAIHPSDSLVPQTPIVVNVTPLITYPSSVAEPVEKNPVRVITKLTRNSPTFSDYFSQDNSAWETCSGTLGCKIHYENGRLKFGPLTSGSIFITYISSTLKSFTVPNDFIVEFDATKEGRGRSHIGIYLRKIDYQNYYRFSICNDSYNFLKIMNNESTCIIPWTRSSTINYGPAMNTIKIKCEKDTFTFYINGEEVNSCTDATFPTGGLSLAAGMGLYFSYRPLIPEIGSGDKFKDNTISFDNFKIWSLDN